MTSEGHSTGVAGRPVRVGIRQMPMFTTISSLRAVRKTGDDHGFDHVWGFDHLASIQEGPEGPNFEGWTLMAAMAEATTIASPRLALGRLIP